jgi:hypothetical protein
MRREASTENAEVCGDYRDVVLSGSQAYRKEMSSVSSSGQAEMEDGKEVGTYWLRKRLSGRETLHLTHNGRQTMQMA